MGTIAEVGSKNSVVLFDGVCNFCNASINFIIRHENDQLLKFAPLQSDWVIQTLGEHHELVNDLNTILVVKNGVVLHKSEAVFEIVSHLKQPWNYLRIFKLIPTGVANFFYDLLARNRYALFGKNEQCFLPTPELRKRFLDSI